MMKKITLIAILTTSIFITSCSKNDELTEKTITQSFQNLPDLGDNYVYEGWLIVGSEKISTGRFSNTEGENFTSNSIDIIKVNSATTYVLTIEPATESGSDLTNPSGWIFSKSDFTNNTAIPSTDDALYSGSSNLESATGKFFLKAPSVGTTGSDANGIWFIDALPPTTGGYSNLPTLADGWIYEGWVVVEGTPITTGTFTNVAATDDAAPYSGPDALAAPNGSDGFFPGEDFLISAPASVVFPLDVRGKTAVISIEPYPDNSPAPFTLKPLVGVAGQETAPVLHAMNSNVIASFPTGSVSR